MDRKLVRALLKEVREWAESVQKETGNWKNNLGGMCGITAYIIFIRLKKLGYSPILHKTWGHAFVELEGYILDVTATQFDTYSWKKIVILSRNNRNVKKAWHYRDEYVSEREYGTKMRNAFSDWGIQNPFNPTIQKLMPCDVATRKTRCRSSWNSSLYVEG